MMGLGFVIMFFAWGMISCMETFAVSHSMRIK
jgi:hypothetical protein